MRFLHLKALRGNRLAQKWPLSTKGGDLEKSVPLHLHRGTSGQRSDNNKRLHSPHEESQTMKTA